MIRLSQWLGAGRQRLLAEATTLEDELGIDGALTAIRGQIASADRSARGRLYRLHDELVRRYPAHPAAAAAGIV
jgi:hypothetical protein